MEPKKMFSKIGLSYFLLAVITIALQFLVRAILVRWAPRALENNWSVWLIALAPMYLVGMPVCVKWMRRIPAQRLYQSAIRPGKWISFLMICVFVMYAGNLLGNGVCAVLSRFTRLDLALDLEQMLISQAPGLVFLFVVILAPILEELVFRKLLIDRAIVFGDRTAILLSGFLFGLFHGNFHQLFYAFGLGCLLAYLYIRTGRIRNTIGIHMAINLLGGFFPILFMRALGLDQVYGGLFENPARVLPYLFQHMGTLLLYLLYLFLILGLMIAGLVMLIFSVKKTVLRTGEYAMPAGKTARALFGNVGIWLFIASCVALFVIDMMP